MIQTDMSKRGYAPCHRTLYRKSTTTSPSWIPSPLKFFRTERANCSLLILLLSLRRAIVGE